ncbi:hypothetical protein B0H14DRAFT_3422958 [Mycena olivaceomarginata]|nr:hypothetical protein B0H14DRAFT_3422958 [Mycena olivaceomarginata]
MATRAVKRKRGSNPAGLPAAVSSHTASFSIAEITGSHIDTPITTFVERASEDNRRSYREEVIVAPPSPVKRHRAGQTHAAPTPSIQNVQASATAAETYEMGFFLDDNAPLTSVAEPAPRIVKPSDPALNRFRLLRDSYLGNMLRRDGLIWPSGAEFCFSCRKPPDSEQFLFRCKNCFGDQLLCPDCMVATHGTNPLHRIERWDGGCFVPSSLCALGLRVQLGHPPGECCSEPLALHSSHFVVLHTNGIHEDYYSVLEKTTNNAGIKPPNRYHAFLRMVREYSHLLMLKRAGRGHAISGVMGTQQGELAVRCPCCPIPGVNLPDGWETAPPEFQFLYIFFLAIDACFRLKRRLVSSVLKDPSLGSGWAYMVESVLYRQFLLTVTDQKEMSTCSGLAALDHANTKFSRGYAATGVGMGVCARHEFVQPNGVGDLQKGERYANMDWIAACIMIALDPRLRKVISYDIVCQWWVNLKKRLLLLPPAVRWHLILGLVRFVIPKLHIKGHKIPCQDKYSLELVPGSAQTDGEGIERPWAHIGGVGSSTKEMGPGSREDTLNGHWGSWNWQKVVGMGERLRAKRDRAAKEYATQLDSFTLFSTEQGERVVGWREMVDAYEADDTQKNPYRMTTRGLTEAQVLLEFEQEESERAAAGVPSIHSVSPSSFIAAGLNVEEEQRRVRVQVELKKSGTTAQQIDIVAMRRALNRSLRRLRELQATYTPVSILALGQRENVPADEQPEHVPLFLPSGLTPAQRSSDSMAALAEIENRLRDVQLSSSLELLRRKLHVKSRLVTYKSLQARAQGANTRAKAIVDRNECKIRLHSEKYQMAWEAKRKLGGGDAAAVGWTKLLKEDIRCMEDPEELSRREHKRKAQDERRRQREEALRREGELPPLTEDEERVARGGESVRQVSWIWTGAGMMGADADLEEALRIEWCKAYARTRRWREEMLLVDEEVRRAGVTLEFRAREWDQRAMAVPVGESQWEEWNRATGRLAGWTYERAEGAVAYALKQAAVFRDIAARLTISMTEVRRGRGKRRLMFDDEWVEGGENGAAGGSEVGGGEEQELEDLRGDEVADDDFVFGGGADED